MQLHGQQIIGKKYFKSDGTSYKAYNPGIGKELEPTFYDATEQEIQAAVSQADADFDAIRQISRHQRADFLDAIAEEIMALEDTLIKRASEETGLPEGRITGERGRTVNQLKLFAAMVREGSYLGIRIDNADPNREPLPKPDIRMNHIPLGPVVVFGASNFPLAFSVAGGDTTSALAAGCPVIVKAHPGHPGTSELVGEAIKKAAEKQNMPAGIFSLVHGKHNTVGEKLATHPLVKAVAFTGSFRGGKALFDLTAKREEPIPCFAEMGSVNPVYFLPGRLEESADSLAEQYVNSVNLGVGQFCTNPGLVFGIKSASFDRFIQLAGVKLKETQAGVMLHPGIKDGFNASYAAIAELKGVDAIASGQSGNGCTAQAHLLKVDGRTFIDQPQLQEEMFGPASLIVECKDKEELLAATKTLKGNLTATLQANEGELANYRDLITLLERKVGRLIFNGFPTGVEVCHAMMHGGPFPATTDSRFTSVGTSAIFRFLRPVAYQNFPEKILDQPLQNANPDKIMRFIDGAWKDD